MFGIGMTELLVILVVGLLVLGPKRLPELARSLGRGLAEFRRASTDMRREFLDMTEEARIEPFGDEPSAAESKAPAVPQELADAPAGIAPEPPPRNPKPVADASDTGSGSSGG